MCVHILYSRKLDRCVGLSAPEQGVLSFHSCVLAGEAKLIERVSDEAPSEARADALENSSSASSSSFSFFFSYSDAYGLLCFICVLGIWAHGCCYVHGFS